GAVLEKRGEIASIYVNGVRVAEEENFLFSYNITSLTSAIRKAMNRERTNVGRTAYTDRVKTMLLASRSTDVASYLVKDLKNYEAGTHHDELKWIDVQEHAVKTLSALTRVAFFTPRQLMMAGDIISEARLAGIEIVTIPEKLGERIRGQVDISGEKIRDLMQLSREIDESFEFHFVDESELTDSEREVFKMTESIFQLIGGRPSVIKEVLVSETMRREAETFAEATGLWISSEERIIVKRSQLRSLEEYGGTLLHEAAHATSRAPDVSRAFEHELTSYIGRISGKLLG
ncbi:MAG: ATP-binding protein, partial [Candidatus Thorarchaeota archaeon]